MVQMFVYRVAIDLMGHTLVILCDEAVEQLLPIWIGPYEAHAIASEIDGKEFERPLTHDLLSSVISSLDCRVAKITVTKLEEQTFYAEMTLEKDGEIVEVDSRPSDAIVLALKTGADIFVAEEVLAQTGTAADETEEVERFKELLTKADLSSDTFRVPEESDEGTENNE